MGVKTDFSSFLFLPLFVPAYLIVLNYPQINDREHLGTGQTGRAQVLSCQSSLFTNHLFTRIKKNAGGGLIDRLRQGVGYKRK